VLQQNCPSNLTQYVHYGLRVSEFLANGMMMNNTLLRAFLHRLKNFETGLKKRDWTMPAQDYSFLGDPQLRWGPTRWETDRGLRLRITFDYPWWLVHGIGIIWWIIWYHDDWKSRGVGGEQYLKRTTRGIYVKFTIQGFLRFDVFKT